jgi:hypothetical protein
VADKTQKDLEHVMGLLNTMPHSTVVSLTTQQMGSGTVIDTAVLANGRRFETCSEGWMEVAPVPGTDAGDKVYGGEDDLLVGPFIWPRK